MTAEQQHDTTAELNEALAGALETGNCDGLVPFYTEGATLIPPRGPFTVGRPGIGAFWLGVRNRFAVVTFTTSDLKSLGDTVRRETGTYVMQPNDAEAQAPEGKYLFVWLLVDGEWQIESSIWNRNAESGGGRRASQAGGQGGGAQGGRGSGRRPPAAGRCARRRWCAAGWRRPGWWRPGWWRPPRWWPGRGIPGAGCPPTRGRPNGRWRRRRRRWAPKPGWRPRTRRTTGCP